MSVGAHEQIDERFGERGLLRGFDHRRRIRHGPVGVLARAKRFDDLAGADCHVRRVDEAGLDLAARDVVERLPDVLGEDQLRLKLIPEPQTFRLSSAY